MTRTRRGVAALELALTLPLLIAVVVGIVELSVLMHQTHVVSRVTRDACRVGAMVTEGVDPTGNQIRAAAVAQVRLELTQAGYACGVGCDIDAVWFEQLDWMMLRVTVDIPYRAITGALPFVPSTTHGEFVMLTQQQLPPED